MHNVSFIGVDVALRVETFDEVAVFAERVKAVFAYARHYIHIEHYINRVRNFYAYFCKVAAYHSHRIGNYVHRPAFHRAAGYFACKFVSLSGVHPIVDGTRVLFVFRAYKRSVLYARNVVDFRAVQIAVGQKIFVKLNEFSAFYGFFFERFNLCRASVNPHDFIGLGEFRTLCDEIENLLIFS